VEGTTVRKLAILEPVLVYAMILAYIWNWRYSHSGVWVAILGLMLLSHLARRESAYSLGFRTRNMGECWREIAPALAALSLLMLASGTLLHTMRPVGVGTALASWAAYVPWGVFQQYALNGYFLNRLDAVLGRRAACLIAAALFCGVHAPNWFLMLAAFPAGYCSTLIYRRRRNLYFLGLAHATVGFLLFLVVPDSVSHHLKVGPGYSSFTGSRVTCAEAPGASSTSLNRLRERQTLLAAPCVASTESPLAAT
jgi:membrane protease YdiL (CAAX protease family)